MKERVCRFGGKNELVGIVTYPENLAFHNNRPAVILLNAGLVHRIGPFRINVDLARSFASVGMLALRFDLSGIGESEHSRDTRPRDQRVIVEIQSAMDYLAGIEGVNQFILIGICTGADQAHRAAVADNRVVGAVCMDGYGYKTWRFYLNHYGPKFLNIDVWRNAIKKLIGLRNKLIPDRSNDPETVTQISAWRLPTKDQLRAELIELFRRDIYLLYIYSGGVATYYNYRGQFEDAFKDIDFEDNLLVKHFPLADHLYMVIEDRRKLIDTIVEWLQTQFRFRTKPLNKSLDSIEKNKINIDDQEAINNIKYTKSAS